MSGSNRTDGFNAATAGAAVHRGGRTLLRCTGPDALPLLHRLSTNAVLDLAAGQVRATALCDPKGRLVERVHVLRGADDTVWVVPGYDVAAVDPVLAYLDRYTITDDVQVEAVAELALVVLGPDAWAHAAALPGAPADPSAYVEGEGLRCWSESWGGKRVVWITGAMTALGAMGARLEALAAGGAPEIDDDTFDAARVALGWPAFGAEITPERNPLEVGLGPDLDFTKGCYIGQEVVARLWYYEKQKQQLVRCRLDGDPGPVPVALADGAGTCTSAAEHPGDGWRALAFVRGAHAAVGSPVRAGDASGTVLGRVGSDPDAPPPS